MITDKETIYEKLKELKIPYEVVDHPPVFTMEEMDQLGLTKKGTLCKNLFLRDAKGKRHFLITCDENTVVDLKSLSKKLGAGNLSFASEERLLKYLGLTEGSVTPFGLLNDTNHDVEFFLDKNLTKAKRIGIHPLTNEATVFLTLKDLEKFLWHQDIDVMKINL
ncbi:MAG TPA: prolyl-tRNA synthetase associated domain-containing protein [Candidatus Dorea intestinavium]|nr:prolyl-tRNA synthetase associated domain-containing protein [Candidatus Dorea intestinavium]